MRCVKYLVIADGGGGLGKLTAPPKQLLSVGPTLPTTSVTLLCQLARDPEAPLPL